MELVLEFFVCLFYVAVLFQAIKALHEQAEKADAIFGAPLQHPSFPFLTVLRRSLNTVLVYNYK